MIYWQVKIWALLHDPALKALHDRTGRAEEGDWKQLDCMEGWVSPKAKDKTSSPRNTNWLNYVALCDLISSASDRATIGRLPNLTGIDYDSNGLEICHLLSGAKQTLKLQQWHHRVIDSGRKQFLKDVETALLEPIKTWEDPRKAYWWLWRCYPEVLANGLGKIEGDPCIPLLPAETRLPDASLWSHTSVTSALAGALAGYYTEDNNYPKKGKHISSESRPYIVSFTFTPVQELIKASRKMRDFWAGSWLLHYLSAKICWAIAHKYGPDTLLYPCLYEQPLIDLWLLEKYPDFNTWIKAPSDRQLLTAGFPNVLVFILPDNGTRGEENTSNPINAAMQYAEAILKEAWKELGEEVLQDLQTKHWIKDLNLHTWDGWLDAQWQCYWTAVPFGDPEMDLARSPRSKKKSYKTWKDKQNEFTKPQTELLDPKESDFLEATYTESWREDLKAQKKTVGFEKRPNLNVGSWWAQYFDLTRLSLTAVKNARSWQLPTAFGPRSTISGIGPVVHANNGGKDWVTEGETRKLWQKYMGMFDGIEELNATEVIKRGLHKILPKLLKSSLPHQEYYYPDLSAGVAGWLRETIQKEGTSSPAVEKYREICRELCHEFKWAEATNQQAWGIPWVEKSKLQLPHPRLLNAGWAIEDFQAGNDNLSFEEFKREKQKELEKVRNAIASYFPPGSNPTDWYVIAAGDGDSMGEWLKGTKLKPYQDYLPEALPSKIKELPDVLKQPFSEFTKVPKRMGPATHSALSRALLDFSNQLLPYLTEERYAGRLIYGGGDDVLAYTNLWEWDNWLWDVRSCFQGKVDPKGEFEGGDSRGDYWQWKNADSQTQNPAFKRPLFTMGRNATISFGIVIAHQSVPLAIALEHLWKGEKEAKEHENEQKIKKDAVQVRVIYGNGNILKATAKFATFEQWRKLLELEVDSALFENAAQLWEQHPVPVEAAIEPWVKAFISRRETLQGDEQLKNDFSDTLTDFLTSLWQNSLPTHRDAEIKSWLKLAAFIIRSRKIEIRDFHN